ncbi:MAG: PH domain-containing protein [Anaerolineales bacterium]|jgi:hypothetical protein
MSLLRGMLGHASEISIEKLQADFGPMLISGEQLEKAYKVVRDLFVFTDRRLILVDKQGLTGKKTEHLSIPYKNIVLFSKESAGFLDLDAELKIWVRGLDRPIVKEFTKDSNVNDVYQLLSHYVLS